MKNTFQPKKYLIYEQLIKAVRKFFDQQKFHEVIAPVLNQSMPLEPNIYTFEAKWHYRDQEEVLHLPTSSESALKKILALGFAPCYAIGHSFRNFEPADEDHNPEFLMLEWYRDNADYKDAIQDCKELVIFVKKEIDQFLNQEFLLLVEYNNSSYDLSGDWPLISLEEKFIDVTGRSIKYYLSLEKIQDLAADFGYHIENSSWESLFNQIFIDKIEPNLPETAFFLVDFPSKVSPLCGVKAGKPYLSERFELYFGDLEVANGSTEQTDRDIVGNHFLQEKKYRQKNNLPMQAIDQDFLATLSKLDEKNVSYAGVGLGLERLLMFLTNSKAISEFNPFSLRKA
ncbi:MAG: amino acid--tRNA ligase-related protein [Patescibacteria group bacterium]|nr:amino acid--tRNA ligase-related protein [Patescibacteria group bacterium]